MRPVNLLPGEHRPRTGSGSRAGSAYVVVGALAAMVVMALVYVLTANQVSSRQDEAAQAKREAAAAQSEIASLGAFGNFAQVKAVRLTSVKSLAQARFDWERFLRELAHVVPANSWFTEVDAATSESARSGGAAGAPAATPAAAGAQTGPSAKLKGCAPSQPDVATLMVRARQLNRVTDVQLVESKEQGSDSGAASSGSTSDAGGECPDGYKGFDLVVVFDPLAAAERGAPERVPASLGGGS
jgi:Tfp pilus assembly protein PilN